MPRDNKINANTFINLQSLIGLSDESFGLLLLKNDLIYEKIPKEIIHDIISCALKIGECVANFLLKKYSFDPIKLAKALNIRIIEDNTSKNRVGSIYIFSEYVNKPPTIIVYSKAIKGLEKIINKHNLNVYLKVDDLTSIFIAHEIFHHLEENMIGSVGQIFKIKTFSLGPIKIKSGIRILSDIAAYHFSKKLLKLHFPPALLPYLILIDQKDKIEYISY